MVNDSLGVISNAHVVHADMSPLKARDPKCLQLAELLAIAVDFPKTGAPAVMPMRLRPQEYPDFMEKSEKTSYVSSSVLGKLYRAVRGASSQIRPERVTRADIIRAFDRELMSAGYEDYLDDAAFLKSEYDHRLTALMNQYGIRSEAEVVSGSIISLSKHYRRRQGDVKQRIMFAVQALRRQARNWFHKGYYREYDEDPQAAGLHNTRYAALAQASAWYYVTYHPDYVAEEPPHFLSFPWLLYDKLIAIKDLANENNPLFDELGRVSLTR
eukprot:TRINITY_DN2815_c0_g2_i1.p1 TRINITY_DN2815_c0_g2~~TRINITY_DN2815_c0_g2_i1.p1  ORF type:complete len:270 (+),score=30.09 TRINITY_DN2815_c0_g2_i1:188-997(+)